jgi:FAD:protein FMN transferase
MNVQVPPNRKKISPQIRRRIFAAMLLVLLAIAFKLLWGKQTPDVETLIFSGNTMSTSWQVKIVGHGFQEDHNRRLADILKDRLDFVNREMSPYFKGGDIYRLNAAQADTPVQVHEEVMHVLKRAVEISELTGGAFDVTVGPLIRLWGFHGKKARTSIPSDDEIANAKSLVGYRHLNLDLQTNSVTKTIDGLDVDLSAIAKGRAVDMVAEALDAVGESRYMVEVGGEIRCKGKNDKDMDWRIGIERPAESNDLQRRVKRVLPISGLSLATSGDYRAFYMLNHKRYSHTIDPRTGRPVEHGLASVSVLTEDCTTADALATGFTVLGVRESIAIADKEKVAAYFMERDRSGEFLTFSSRAFDAMFGNIEDME